MARTSKAPSQMSVIGVDIGKDVFHLVGFNADGKIVLRKKIRRLGLVPTFEKLPRCIVGMEACLSAHFVSRTLRKLGFQARLIPAIYVKPFLKGQKNDYNDAEAIAEAALRPNLRTVREKTQDQLDLQAMHRVRSRLVSRRTATINQIRAFLIEQGIAVRKGAQALRKSLFPILDLRRDEISERMHGNSIGHRHRRGIRSRPRLRRLDWARTETTQYGRQADPRTHVETRQQVSAHAVRSSGTYPIDAAGELAKVQFRDLVGAGRSPPAQEQARRGTGQQTGPDRVERSAAWQDIRHPPR